MPPYDAAAEKREVQTERARQTEFHDLVSKVASVEQFRRWTDADVDDDLDRERRERLAELSDLLNPDETVFRGDGTPSWDPETHIRRWVETHPLALTGAIMVKVIREASRDADYPGNGVAVAMQIGDPQHSGRYYPLHAGMFVAEHGVFRLNLPDSIAEEFRQQGIRKIQREFADLMAVQSYR